MKKSENQETIIPQVKLSSDICFAILEQMGKSREVLVEDVDEVLDMALAQLRLCIKEAQRSSRQPSRENRKEQWHQKYREAKERFDKATAKKEAKREHSDDNIKKSANAVQHLFSAYSMLESFLAKSENRPVNTKGLTKMAKRLTKACFKDIEGVNAENIRAELHQNDNEITVEVLMPKNDEE